MRTSEYILKKRIKELNTENFNDIKNSKAFFTKHF